MACVLKLMLDLVEAVRMLCSCAFKLVYALCVSFLCGLSAYVQRLVLLCACMCARVRVCVRAHVHALALMQ